MLLEAGENKSYNTIKEYLDNIDPTLKTDIKNYKLKLYLAYQNYNIDFLYLRQKIKKSGFPNFFIYILTTFNLLKHV